MSDTIEAPPLDQQIDPSPAPENQDDAGRSEATTEATQGEAQPKEQQPQADKTPAWLQRKIDKMTFERREAERREQASRDELEQMRRALAEARGETQQEESLTPDQIRQQERQRYETQAAEQQSVSQFNMQANAIAKAVAATHGDAAVAQATQLLSERAGLDFNNKSHRELIADISELPNSGDVYYAL
ncbi:hypothetical protein, partial [Kozakia baliensis]|uniref:hypothetical protein n=1 Tax=Kozakia baliensis TaxID=153496 RepID=UPI000495F07A